MEQIYPKPRKICKLVKTRPEKVKFLLDYSKASTVVKCGNLIFDNNQN